MFRSAELGSGIGVLAVKPPGLPCSITLFLLQLVAFINRFYTNYTSVRREKQEEEAGEAGNEADEKKPLPGAYCF